MHACTLCLLLRLVPEAVGMAALVYLPDLSVPSLLAYVFSSASAVRPDHADGQPPTLH
jgi:hypothetical protein